MATFLCKTKDDVSAQGKPRVYFTCHPKDFDRYFVKICKDIFKTHNCAVYYTKDMTERIAEQDKATDLGQMNLFVVPVTFSLLSKPNRAMDEDIAYAKQHNIPILPFMMESGIDAFYSAPDKFGQLQYINPFSSDRTEISYADKLKRYLEAVLISDETAQRVRDAFDAYIFLSYRKKDRHYANQLMRLIHKNPEYRDIAIWYDEFLTPGESFAANIEKALNSSKLFALLVTPNLLEEPDGKPNFVMAEEYPAAKKSGKPILPAEMEDTDKEQLRQKYTDIPDCVLAKDQAALRTSLLQALERIAKSENNNDPEHNFLIGLAYLDGIDVEVDRERALTLITSAAQADLPEAIRKLRDMYEQGAGVELDYQKATDWAERLVACYQNLYGEQNEYTLLALNGLSVIVSKAGDYNKELETAQKAYTLMCRSLGEEHAYTLTALGNLAVAHSHLGDFKQALFLEKKVYEQKCNVLGEDDPSAILALNNLAVAHSSMGDYTTAISLLEKAYETQCRVLGEKHPHTVLFLNNLANTCGARGGPLEAIEYNKKAYALSRVVLGEEHPQTLSCMNSMACRYKDLMQFQKALDILEPAHDLQCKVLGEEHPDTLTTLVNLADVYRCQKQYPKAIALNQKAYDCRCRIFGKTHPESIIALNNLSIAYLESGRHQEALEINKELYKLQCNLFGPKHPSTLLSLHNTAQCYSRLGKYEKSIELQKKALSLRRQTLGMTHQATVSSIVNLIISYLLYPFRVLLRLFKPAKKEQTKNTKRRSSGSQKGKSTSGHNPLHDMVDTRIANYKRWLKIPIALIFSLLQTLDISVACACIIGAILVTPFDAKLLFMGGWLVCALIGAVLTVILIICSKKCVFSKWWPAVLCPLLVPHLYLMGLMIASIVTLDLRKEWKAAIEDYQTT